MVSQPTVIGVVGNTGAGKSSVINAMLDEERLVPTNWLVITIRYVHSQNLILILLTSMRACTAVVTEMSWNDRDGDHCKYRAAIEFIQPEDWQNELRVLFAELLDANGNVSDRPDLFRF